MFAYGPIFLALSSPPQQSCKKMFADTVIEYFILTLTRSFSRCRPFSTSELPTFKPSVLPHWTSDQYWDCSHSVMIKLYSLDTSYCPARALMKLTFIGRFQKTSSQTDSCKLFWPKNTFCI